VLAVPAPADAEVAEDCGRLGRVCGAGWVGVVAQSGGELDRLGLGVSTALSVGALDVNGDDMLLWWGADWRTRAAVPYAAIRNQLLDVARRVAWLATRLPELAEAEINHCLPGRTGTPQSTCESAWH
jgi:hypothetical protein